jgi:glycosyltransferase involved in cell wall biosynthesis
MPKILHVMHDFHDNSMTRIVTQIVQHLSPKGYEFHTGAVTDSPQRREELREQGATTVEFFQHKSVPDAIRAYVQEHKIDLVHSHSPRTAIHTSFALRRLSHIPHAQTRHLLATPQSRRMGILYTAVDRASLFMSDLVVPVSKTMGEQIRGVPGIDSRKVEPIQNGVDTQHFFVPEVREEVRQELGIAQGETVLIFTGRLEVMKRIDILLSALAGQLAQFPNTRLLLLGEGTMKDKLMVQAQQSGIAERVHWLGFRRDVPRLLAAADVYVQSSNNEGLSLSILEAMAAGKTIISTDVGAAREVLQHGDTALIVPADDAAGFSEALRDVLANPQKAATLARNARRIVNEQFSVEKMASAYGDVYRRLLS